MIDILDDREYTEAFLMIRTKGGDMIPFRWNAPQRRLYAEISKQERAGLPVRVVILKARQLGFSTMAEGLIFHRSATRFNTDSLIIAHDEKATANLYKMSRLFFDELPGPLQPMTRTSNAQEMIFENPTRRADEKRDNPGLRSRIRCVTAGGRGVGRSYTVHNLHASEVAFWENAKDVWVGAIQAVPSAPGTMVIVESTANGFNWFKDFWDKAVRGESDFIPVFFAWFENPEYSMAVPPDFVASDEELELQTRFGLTDGQLVWRRWAISNNCDGDIDKFKQEYPATADEAFLHSGSPVFDNEVVIWRRDEVRELVPVLRGEFVFDVGYDEALRFVRLEDIKFCERAGGFIRIFVEPVPGRPYVIGGDTAGEGSDWFTAHVLDNTSGHQVAVLRQQFDEHEYTRQVYCLGRYYNWAVVGVEANYSTYPIATLSQMGYPHQFVREKLDTFSGQLKKSFGFLTDLLSRPVIIADLVKILRESPECVCDFETLGEMLTFVYNERRRPEAMAGAFDDLVMGLAIAFAVRPQQEFRDRGGPAAPETVWTKDMWEDFERASDDARLMLIELWGRPLRR